MATTQDFTAAFKDIMGSFPIDTKAMEDAFKSQTTLAEKMSDTSLTAAQQSTDLAGKWATDTLTKMQALAKTKAEPADYAKSFTDFASASAETATEYMAAFADIAKKVQTQTTELMMAAGKDMSEEATKAAKKVTEEVTAATKTEKNK